MTRVCIVVAVVAGLMGATCAHAACAPPPPAVTDIHATRPYSDQTGTVIDDEAEAQNREETKPLTDFLRAVSEDADRAWKQPGHPDADAGKCAVSWLAAWAQGRAWLGTMGSKQAAYERNWDLAGAALAYVKVRTFATAEQRAVIDAWLIAFADKARTFFDDRKIKRNNHWYWHGLGQGAVGLATGSKRHWQAARSIAQDAARDIGPNGGLPLELARKSRALHYHAFSLTPLVTLATLARSKGEDFYAFGHQALGRLAALTARGLADPAVFKKLAGVAQSSETRPGVGWSQLYALHDSKSAAAKVSMPHSHRWLGGDVQLLVRAIAK